jgi:putative ABC transport system permease protein
MRLIFKLLLAQFRRHWIRTLLALSAVTTAVAMVVVIIGGQTATTAQAEAPTAKPLGPYRAILYAGSPEDVSGEKKRTGANPPLPPFDPELVNWVSHHPDVAGVMDIDAMSIEMAARPAGAGGRRRGGGSGATTQAAAGSQPVAGATPSAAAAAALQMQMAAAALTPGFDAPSAAVIYGTSATDPFRKITSGDWLSDDEPNGIVLDSDVAARLQRNVGDVLQITTVTGKKRAKVVGIMDAPVALRGLTAMYVAPDFFATLSGKPYAPNRLYVSIKENGSQETFIEQFNQHLSAIHQAAQVDTVDAMIEDAAKGAIPRSTGVWFFPLLQDAAVKIAIVAAMFIIFNTFSMGLQERTRQLAMLRAIGMTRARLVATLLAESMAIALVGWLLGMVIGWYVLNGNIAARDAGAGAMGMMGRTGVQIHLDLDVPRLWILGAVTAFGAVLIATLVPAFLASRKRPLEGMSTSPMMRLKSAPWWITALGAALVLLNPLAAMTPVFPDPMRSHIIMPISFITALIGFVLLTPVILQITEPVFVLVASRLLFLNPRMLRRSVSANLWRTVGCISALMVGLGLYMVVHIWGESMAAPFLMNRVPDAVIIVSPTGVPIAKAPALATLDGVTAALPIMLEHPTLADLPDYVLSNGGLEMFFSKDMLYLGCDLHTLLEHDNGMFDGIFVRGSRAEADKLLAAGNACLITDNLWRRVPERYDVGKTIAVTTENFPHQTITYTIAGVVQMDGWHQFSQRTRMRRNQGRVGGLVMVPVNTALAAYPSDTFRTLWFKLQPEVKPASLETPIMQIVDPNAAPATMPVAAVADGSAGGAGGGMRRAPRGNSPIYCQTIDTRLLAGAQRDRIKMMIDSIAYYPLWALALASVAVVNTLFASIRARSWDIGILRSIGQTRSQVIRQVLAEGILIGLVACAVSLAFALLASKAGIIASSRTMDVAAPYTISWIHLGIGLGLAMVICVIASVVPAFLAARRQPLSLLQAGRAMA